MIRTYLVEIEGRANSRSAYFENSKSLKEFTDLLHKHHVMYKIKNMEIRWDTNRAFLEMAWKPGKCEFSWILMIKETC